MTRGSPRSTYHEVWAAPRRKSSAREGRKAHRTAQGRARLGLISMKRATGTKGDDRACVWLLDWRTCREEIL